MTEQQKRPNWFEWHRVKIPPELFDDLIEITITTVVPPAPSVPQRSSNPVTDITPPPRWHAHGMSLKHATEVVVGCESARLMGFAAHVGESDGGWRWGFQPLDLVLE